MFGLYEDLRQQCGQRLGAKPLDAYPDYRRSRGTTPDQNCMEVSVQRYDDATVGRGPIQDGVIGRYREADVTDVQDVVA